MRDPEGVYRLHFAVADGTGNGGLELRDFELTKKGKQGEVSLLAADLRPRPNRPLILGLSAEPAAGDALWLKLTWMAGAEASR